MNVAADADGVWWATLTAVDNAEFIVHRYGRGVDHAVVVEINRSVFGHDPSWVANYRLVGIS